MITCTLGEKKYHVDYISGRALREMEPAAKMYGRIVAVSSAALKGELSEDASKDPRIITSALHDSIAVGNVRKRRYSGKSITIGVHRKERGAYYATPVEYGHGGPAPAPAHPFIRPAYDTRADEAYEIIRDGLRDAIDNL